MSAGLRCPKCPHVFPAEGLRPPARLKCPRCGHVFDIRAAAPPPAPLAIPIAAPPDNALDFTSQPGTALRPGRRPPRQKVVVIACSAAGALALLLGVVLIVGKKGGKSWPDSAPFNFAVRELPSAWQPNEDLPPRIGCRWAWSRGEPSCLCALDAEDHEKGFPGQAALVKGFTTRIGKFLSAVEWSSPAPSSRDNLMKLGTLGGQPAYVLEFEGERHSARYVGECYVMEHRGFVYWFFALSPQPVNEDEHQALRRLWSDMRNCFRLLDRREGWMPQ